MAILFSRAPTPGLVKSRLHTHLSPEQACALHVASTLDTAELIARALPLASKWIFWSEAPAPQDQTNALSGSLRLPRSFRAAVQQGDGLAERMADAFSRAFTSGARHIVIFGSDSPTLPAACIQQSFAALADCDLVLGPTEDGGYYLIGCRQFDPRLFADVEWSTPRTFIQTLRNAEQLGFRVQVLAPWYDLDEWKDVERMLQEARQGRPLPRHLVVFLEQLRKEKGETAPPL